jgi:outer membrane protein assembly factor BamB
VTTGKVQWQAKIEGRAIGAPAVGADEVYVALSDGKVVALAQSDGKQRWQAETGHSLTTGPTVADGVLFLGTNEGLLALDLATRQSKWECAIPGANADAGAMNGPGIVFVNPPGGIAPGRAPVRGEAAPLVVGGTVYAGAGDKLYAFEAGNGAARWTLSPLPPDRAPGAGPPAGPAGVPPGVLRIQGGGQLIIRGNVRFINQLNDGAARAPAAAAADGLALLASADGLFAAASRDGLQMWCYPTPAPADAPVVAGGVIYFTCGPGNGLAPGFRNGPPGPGAAPWALFALPIQAAGK